MVNDVTETVTYKRVMMLGIYSRNFENDVTDAVIMARSYSNNFVNDVTYAVTTRVVMRVF